MSADPTTDVAAPHRRTLLVTMCAGYFLVLLDVTVVNVALPRLGADLHVHGAALSWAVTGYAVPFAALLLAAGTAGDRYGHRRIVLAGLVLFGIGSLACALSPGLAALVASRAVQGVGAALLLPGTLAEVTTAFPGPERARAIGVWAAIGGAALPAGPVLGGLLVTAAGWRAVFWINLPVVLVAHLVALRVLPRAGGDRSRRGDPLGTALGALGLALLVFGAGQALWWVALAAVPVFAVFLVTERRLDRGGRQPVFPVGLLADRRFALPNLGALVMNGTCQGMLFLLALLLQDVQGRTPLGGGLAALPVFLPLAAVPPLAGRLVARFDAIRVAAVAFVLVAAGLVVLANGPLTPALLVWGIGLGLLTPAIVTAAVTAVPADRAGLASAVNNTARQAGGALGIAVCAAAAGPATAPGFVAGFRWTSLVCAGLCVLLAGALGAHFRARGTLVGL